ncbi:Nudix hydrolase 20, partial [Monoraphidium neglectum]
MVPRLALACYVEDADGGKRLWVARRSSTKQTWPGKLDHIVAGGQPFGLSCRENVVKECGEEASIPQELASQAVATGFVSYVSILPEGLKPDVLFTYDLKLPPDFVPKPQDGEVEEFMLWDLPKVADVIAHTDDYKPNCGVVVMDFL